MSDERMTLIDHPDCYRQHGSDVAHCSYCDLEAENKRLESELAAARAEIEKIKELNDEIREKAIVLKREIERLKTESAMWKSHALKPISVKCEACGKTWTQSDFGCDCNSQEIERLHEGLRRAVGIMNLVSLPHLHGDNETCPACSKKGLAALLEE